MSKECPNGHGRQPVIKNITADLGIPQKATDVIAFQLKCGCTVGGEEHAAFAVEVERLKNMEAEELRKVRKAFAGKKAQAFKTFINKEGE